MMSPTLFGPETLADTIPPAVEVYTDGGCDPNPGPGGWGAIIRWSDREWILRGNDADTTNNRMELHAAAAALAVLEGLLGRCQVDLYTDSEYLRQGITEWIDDWVGRGWRTKGRQPVKNQDLWRVLHRFTRAHDVTWHWLEGHAGHPLNERADRLATQAREALQRAVERAETRQVAGEGPEVEIAIKAAARGSGGPAGWGAVLRMGDHVKVLSDKASSATANAMLIRGATEALQALNRPCRVAVYSDADYLIKGASQWATGWQARDWETRSGQPVANREAWEALLEAARAHQVTWIQARGEDAPDDLARAGELAAEAIAPEASAED